MSPTRRSGAPATPATWLLLIYRVPTDSSRARVAVWRDLKRMGAFYLQQAVCVLPDRAPVRAKVEGIRTMLDDLGGSSTFLTLSNLDEATSTEFVAGFRNQSEREYAEIVEECETKFFKEIEFERFRENYTFEEAEEIRQDLEKLKRWLTKVEDRDYLAAEGHDLAAAKIAECESLLEAFESDVYDRTGGGEG